MSIARCGDILYLGDTDSRIHRLNISSGRVESPIDDGTLLPLALRPLPPDEIWTEALEERMVEALREAGIAFEVSNRYRPHERLVQRAVEGGVRLSLGSDGHSAEQVVDLAAPLALTRALGVPDEELYDPLVHGSRVPARP